ncbi:MAG: biotin/lipoyl-binding protein [Prolixibacteraceae bacterium]|jgi:biotin carboxyl carrier protein|nr:biotin/lipoyl-binding protein [Prolixibacteraceae bacterium]MBT6763417.1 biotin/lipoyl-binding protein [Prolixibacteraceae bacterium]MBT6997150.1 biotin/lipoyl-binding protein [Prolixibacteraceae bacterium]MBT7393543.1 biotin/lipoyl-binding protein [Prolixibacteraceae bacterium]
MAIEVKLEDRIAWVNLISQKDNILEVEVDGVVYKVDLMHTADGTFSIIENGHSYNIELVPHKQPKKYTAHTLYKSLEVEIIDAEARYLKNRGSNGFSSNENTISSPMPGKVVKILVNEGDKVKEGEILIIISAMKMESEYSAPKDGIVNKINVKNGDTIEGNQILIELE